MAGVGTMAGRTTPERRISMAEDTSGAYITTSQVASLMRGVDVTGVRQMRRRGYLGYVYVRLPTKSGKIRRQLRYTAWDVIDFLFYCAWHTQLMGASSYEHYAGLLKEIFRGLLDGDDGGSDLYLSRWDAAKELGITLGMLGAFKRAGMIKATSVPGSISKRHVFAEDEVERFSKVLREKLWLFGRGEDV